MNKLTKYFAVILFFFAYSISIFACDIDFEVASGKKASYSNGDEVIVKLHIVFTHRNCPEGIDKTELKTKGLEIVSATKWSEKSPGVWERKLKIKITDAKAGSAKIDAIRVCSKEGGRGSLILTTK